MPNKITKITTPDNTEYDIVDDKAYHTDDTIDTTIANNDYIPFYDTSDTSSKKINISNLANSINTDSKVDQNNNTDNKNYRLLLSSTDNNTDVNGTANKSGELYANPSTGRLRCKRFSVENNEADTVYPFTINLNGRGANETPGGDIRPMVIYYQTKDLDGNVQGRTSYPISVIGNNATNTNNTGVRLGSHNGTTIVGAGESSLTFASAQSKYNDENLYLTSDNRVHLYQGLSNDSTTFTSHIEFPNTSGTVALTTDLPTKVSDLTNDIGFVTTDENVKQSILEQTDTGWHKVIVGGTALSETIDKTYIVNGFNYRPSTGTLSIDSADGVANESRTNIVKIGNNKTKATTNHVEGRIDLYGENGGYATLKYDTSSTTHKTLTIPAKDGTIATTSDIPTVNDATLDIQLNGTTVNSFTANASSNVTTNIKAAVNNELNTEDLDTVKVPGFYVGKSGNTCSNKPSGVNQFGLYVIKLATSNNNYWKQTLVQPATVVNGGSKTYSRSQYNGTWTSWIEEKYTDTTYSAGTGISISSNEISNSGVRSIATGTLFGSLSVNEGGTSSDKTIYMNAPEQPTSQDLNTYKTSGIYYFKSETGKNPTNTPAGAVNGVLIVIKSDWSARDMIKQIWMRHGTNNSNDNQIFTRSFGVADNAWSYWHEIVTSKSSSTSSDASVIFEMNGRNGKAADAQAGTAAVLGETTIYVGNGTASGSDGNSRGNIRIYGTDNRYVRLTAQDTMINNYRSQLPSKSGILGLTSDIAPYESGTTASESYDVGDYLIWRSQLYKVISDISYGDTLTANTNVKSTTICDELKWKTFATSMTISNSKTQFVPRGTHEVYLRGITLTNVNGDSMLLDCWTDLLIPINNISTHKFAKFNCNDGTNSVCCSIAIYANSNSSNFDINIWGARYNGMPVLSMELEFGEVLYR